MNDDNKKAVDGKIILQVNRTDGGRSTVQCSTPSRGGEDVDPWIVKGRPRAVLLLVLIESLNRHERA